MVTSLSRAALVGLSLPAAAVLGVAPALAQPPSPPVSVGENPVHAPPQERAAALAHPAIVYIKAKFTAYVILPDGRSLNRLVNDFKPFTVDVACTGFGVSPDGYIATAGHCVDTTSRSGIKYNIIEQGANRVNQLYPSTDVQKFIDGCLDNCTVEGKLKDSPPDSEISVVGGAAANGSVQDRPARVVGFRPFDEGDVALIKIDASDGPQPSIELAPSTQLQIGTPVLAIGYLADIAPRTGLKPELTNKDGQVSAKKSRDPVPVYEISAAVSAGMSGGPTIGLDGRVLGINSFKAAGEAHIAPAGELVELLNQNGVRNQLGANDVTYRQGLTDYFSGEYTRAIADFDKLLAVFPNHPQALDYKTRAAIARDRFGDPIPPAQGPGVLRWVLIGAAGLLIVAVVAIVLLRPRGRHRRAQPAGPRLSIQRLDTRQPQCWPNPRGPDLRLGPHRCPTIPYHER
ncbi:MAG: trypsin-like peptidase domain-containing protein [Pseudonocardiaceae bacterium]